MTPNHSIERKLSVMRAAAVSLITILFCLEGWAAPSSVVTAEIEHLFSYLSASGCDFNRNGKWYSSEKAIEHLRGKYTYLLKKELVTSSESFVERAASKSSASGNPYLVRCGSAEPVKSGAWFLEELVRHRATNKLPANLQPTQLRGAAKLARWAS